jgi:excisionase family DNA binding protein
MENSILIRNITTEELQAFIKGCIREEIESILQGMNQQESVPERINLIEAAKYLGLKKSTMYKLTMTRKIPFSKFGRKIIFYTKELDEWIKQNSLRIKTREELEREASEYIMRSARKKLSRGNNRNK